MPEVGREHRTGPVQHGAQNHHLGLAEAGLWLAVIFWGVKATVTNTAGWELAGEGGKAGNVPKVPLLTAKFSSSCSPACSMRVQQQGKHKQGDFGRAGQHFGREACCVTARLWGRGGESRARTLGRYGTSGPASLGMGLR